MIWDTAGEERYRQFSASFCRGAAAIILCYDITNRSKFENLDFWLNYIRNGGIGSKPIMVASFKCDLDD